MKVKKIFIVLLHTIYIGLWHMAYAPAGLWIIYKLIKLEVNNMENDNMKQRPQQTSSYINYPVMRIDNDVNKQVQTVCKTINQGTSTSPQIFLLD